MTTEEIKAMRAKYNIPTEGFKVSAPKAPTSSARLAELNAAWAQHPIKSDVEKVIDPARPLPGADTAAIPTKPAGETGLGFKDLAKTVPNALHDVWDLVKESTYGTGKKIIKEIPEAFKESVDEQGLGNTIKNTIKSVPGALKDTAIALVPQSAKEIANTDAIGEIPHQFKELVKENGGSYSKALLATLKASPGAIPDSVLNYANQIDRARQSAENHPVNEFLGYLGLKSLAEHRAAPKAKETPAAPETPSTVGPFKNSFKPEVAELFQEEGIKAPISAISDNAALRGAEALSSKGMFGAGVRDTALKAIEEVEKRTNAIVEKIKPDKPLSDEALGKVVQEGLIEFEKEFKLTEGKVYEEFNKTYGKSNVFGKATKDALNTLIKEQGADQFKGIDPRLSKMYDRITGRNNPEILEVMDKIEEFKSRGKGKVPDELTAELKKAQDKHNKSLTFSELKSTRTAIGEALNREPDNSALKRLYGAVSKDMETAVKQVGDMSPFDLDAQVAVEALHKLNDSFRLGKSKIESNISQSIKLSNPESIAKNIIKRNSAETLQLVKEMIGEKRFAEVQKTFFRELLETSRKRIQKKVTDAETVVQDKFDVAKLKKQLAEYDAATLQELLTPEQMTELNTAITQLEKFEVMGESLKAGQKMAEGSQTAFLGKLSAFSGALFSGQFQLAVGILLGDLALKTLFTSKFGRKLLTEGLTVPNLKALNGLKNLSEANKQLIIQSMRSSQNEK